MKENRNVEFVEGTGMKGKDSRTPERLRGVGRAAKKCPVRERERFNGEIKGRH